jgi:sugar O-acyltransferase (sialic acid O-acetyltransferase NeuD family)
MRYLVIGASGYGQEVAWSLRAQCDADGRHCAIAFFDDRAPVGPVASGLGEVVGGIDAVAQHARGGDAALVLGVGLPRVKAAVVARLAGLDVPWATVIHPAAVIGANVTIGDGGYVGAGAVCTVNARVGRFVTINLHCQVAHDDVIEDFVTLHPDTHLSGGVVVEEGSELGTGSICIPGVRVGPWSILGAGAVAVRALEGWSTYTGLPAKPQAPRQDESARLVAVRRAS